MEQKHQDKLRIRAGHYISDDISIWLKDNDKLEIETENFRVVLSREQAEALADHINQLWLGGDLKLQRRAAGGIEPSFAAMAGIS